MCIAMNLYLLPVYDLVVMQVLAAQQDLNYFKVTVDYYLMFQMVSMGQLVGYGQVGSLN